jgi:vacuolar-type H+-ATPase subunit E/Vma4
MTAADPALVAALAPVRDALRAAAAAQARGTVDQARSAAATTLATARAEADRIRATARDSGRADAAAALAIERARVARQARAVVLTARRQAYETLHQRAREAVGRLCEDRDYPAMRGALVGVARAALGGGAAVREADGGGILAEVPDRRVDLSLAGFAARAVEEVVTQRGGAP